MARVLGDDDPGTAQRLHLSPALPFPPAMIAPAWPMRRPGGAVLPAMNATTGFFRRAPSGSGDFFFGGAADLADHDDRLGLGSAWKAASTR